MKKPLLWLVGLAALSAMFIGVASAAVAVPDLFTDGYPNMSTAYAQLLNNYDNTWWYTDSNFIWGDFIDWNLRITSPIIEDIELENATDYYLVVSPYRLNQLKNWDSSVDLEKVTMTEVELTADASNVEFIVWTPDYDSEQTYYGFIAPVDVYDVFGTPSSEICFKLSSSTYNQGEGCDAFELVLDPNATLPEDTQDVENQENQENHGAACVGMSMANITHVINGDTITLKWTAVDGDVVQIAVFDPEEQYWKSLGAVNMKDEKFAYKIQWNGEQNFMLTNGCGEVRYKADAAIKPSEPEKVVPPATGPAENVLYIAIAAVILYGAYVLFFRKSEN